MIKSGPDFQPLAPAIGIGRGHPINRQKKEKQMATIGLETQVRMFERLKYEEKIHDLKKSQYASELMQQETFEKINQEFAEKIRQNQNKFEAAIKMEKKEREEEHQRLAQELKVCF